MIIFMVFFRLMAMNGLGKISTLFAGQSDQFLDPCMKRMKRDFSSLSSKTSLAFVNRKRAKTTRPSSPPTSCTSWASIRVSYALIGGSSKPWSINFLNLCTKPTKVMKLKNICNVNKQLHH